MQIVSCKEWRSGSNFNKQVVLDSRDRDWITLDDQCQIEIFEKDHKSEKWEIRNDDLRMRHLTEILIELSTR